MVAGGARRREYAPDGLDRRPQAAQRRTEPVHVPGLTAEIVLHVYDQQRSICGPEIAAERKGMGIARDPILHRATPQMTN
jgi:hypothetical protein